MLDIERLYNIFKSCSGVCTDSRHIKKNSLFFALHGASFDGNAFAASALAEGAAYAIVDSDEPLKGHPELVERLIKVDKTLETLQALSREHRRHLAIPIVGIVGSNGKTTTKELVASVLSQRFRVNATYGNLNNHIGVPLTLLSMDEDTEIGVVEMGASACGEIATLCRIAEPDYGLITNIGFSHLEGFGGVVGIRRGKGELYDYLVLNNGIAFIPREDSVLAEMASERNGLKVEYYSRSIADGVDSKLSGEYNRANIAAAIAIGRFFSVADSRIRSAISNYEPSNNRSQEVHTESNTLIVDCYNANPSSMQVAIDNIVSHEGEYKIAILGDMLELGRWSIEEHTRILEIAMQSNIARVLTIGNEFAKAYRLLGNRTDTSRCICFDSTEHAMEYLRQNRVDGATILIKGSHKWALERIIPIL